MPVTLYQCLYKSLDSGERLASKPLQGYVQGPRFAWSVYDLKFFASAQNALSMSSAPMARVMHCSITTRYACITVHAGPCQSVAAGSPNALFNLPAGLGEARCTACPDSSPRSCDRSRLAEGVSAAKPRGTIHIDETAAVWLPSLRIRGAVRGQSGKVDGYGRSQG